MDSKTFTRPPNGAVIASALIVLAAMIATSSPALARHGYSHGIETRGGSYGQSSSGKSSGGQSGGSGRSTSGGGSAATGALIGLGIGVLLQGLANAPLDEKSEEELESEVMDDLKRQREAPPSAKARRAIRAAENDPSLNPWAAKGVGKREPAPADKKQAVTGCDFQKRAGSCTGTIRLKSTSGSKPSYAARFRVSSSAPVCSKVEYYIDNTPHQTILQMTNSADESTFGTKPISRDNFEVKNCTTYEAR
ncbi:hypothetical protein [Agrobacterium sp. NPDC089420]|uniref:hypothetical protein n=1 Tax=Agrobacterium sp. NPDC089420 TaxID=3363918 RepID=UPI00384CD77E